jgi:hypothetical protein
MTASRMAPNYVLNSSMAQHDTVRAYNPSKLQRLVSHLGQWGPENMQDAMAVFAAPVLYVTCLTALCMCVCARAGGACQCASSLRCMHAWQQANGVDRIERLAARGRTCMLLSPRSLAHRNKRT